MHKPSTPNHRKRGAAATLASALALAGTAQAQAPTQNVQRSVELQILVLSAADGGTLEFKKALDKASVPYTDVNLNATHTINDAFLVETVIDAGVTRRNAKFQAVVLPDEKRRLSDSEQKALEDFEKEFGIREFLAFASPSPAIGLGAVELDGHVDGASATVTSAGAAGPFAYLNAPVPFENNDPAQPESWAYLARPLSAAFTPYLTMPIPSSGSNQGSVLGVFDNGGRKQMVMTAAINVGQYQYDMLFPGILEWLTYGVHLGTSFNYLAVHVDDVFVDNERWNCRWNCVPGGAKCPAQRPLGPDLCPEDSTNKRILMTPADVDYLVSWQAKTGLFLDIVYNGVGSERFPTITKSFLDNKKSLRFLNHTYTHANLDEQPLDILNSEIGLNKQFGINNFLNTSAYFASNELVTGEHSGLQRPNVSGIVNKLLPEALATQGIAWIGSDTSINREQQEIALADRRVIARTVPRYPMSIYYNVGTRLEEVDQYNHIKKLPEGSARADDFEKVVIPAEVKATIRHIIGNDPRPHYVHQPNLTEDRIIYPVLEAVFAEYARIFKDGTPIYNPNMTESGTILMNHANWAKLTKAGNTGVKARIEGTRLTITGAGVTYPITVPKRTSNVEGLLTGSNSQTGWRQASGQQVFELPQRYGQ